MTGSKVVRVTGGCRLWTYTTQWHADGKERTYHIDPAHEMVEWMMELRKRK